MKTHYSDFGPTLATEDLAERHAIHVGRETLRRWTMAEGVWLSCKQRKTFHQPRLWRESYGELVQIDGSEHRWFEDRTEPCTLLVFVDDATSKLMQLHFVPSESTESYFAALRDYPRARLPCCVLLRQALATTGGCSATYHRHDLGLKKLYPARSVCGQLRTHEAA